MKTHDQKLSELRTASAALKASRETDFARIDEAIATHRAADPDHGVSWPLANQEAALLTDSARLDALLNLDITVTAAEGGGFVLIDFRQTPPRSTDHRTGRDAIDAAILANSKDQPAGEKS